MQASVIPFPLSRRVAFVERHADIIAGMKPDSAERHLAHQLKIQREACGAALTPAHQPRAGMVGAGHSCRNVECRMSKKWQKIPGRKRRTQIEGQWVPYTREMIETRLS
jgi:hypothetical protein